MVVGQFEAYHGLLWWFRVYRSLLFVQTCECLFSLSALMQMNGRNTRDGHKLMATWEQIVVLPNACK